MPLKSCFCDCGLLGYCSVPLKRCFCDCGLLGYCSMFLKSCFTWLWPYRLFFNASEKLFL